MTSTHFSNLNGAATWLYNYNVIPISQAEVDYMNSNNMEFVPMFGGAYAQTEQTETILGWPLDQGTNKRCYLWQSVIPTSQSNQYYGSSLCTVYQLVELINASSSVLNVPIRRVAMFNEPWSTAAYPENATESALFYKNTLELVVQSLSLEIVSATTAASSRALEWDVDFLKRCTDYGCNLDLITEWSIHDYVTKYDRFTTRYGAYTGTFYSGREAAFASGYGSWSASQWSSFFRRSTLLFTEHSAEQETATSFGVPDNSGTCLRMSGQFGNAATCASYGNDNGACFWGAGSLNWLLESDHTNVAGVAVWPTYYSPSGSNQVGGRSSRLVYEDGSLTPNGRAFLAVPGDGLSVDCAYHKSPSPPPPAPPRPPLSPPLPPMSPSPPRPPPIRPPIAPLQCSAMNGRHNTQTAFAAARWCYEVKTTDVLGCDAYFSMGTNNRMRLCYNPIYPATDSSVYCASTGSYVMCDFLPPSPPSPPQAPVGGRRLATLWQSIANIPEMHAEEKSAVLHSKYTYADNRM